MNEGLTGVKEEHLVELLRAIHRGAVDCPLTATGLAAAGFLGIQDTLGHLRGLDKRATEAVLTAVLAERRRLRGR